MKQKNENTKKAIAGVVALAVVSTGTFAWQSFNQVANNKFIGRLDTPGARLHDDFDGVNKDIYVENYGVEEDGGKPVYVRIRLDEYMAVGTGAAEGDAGATVLRGDIQKDAVIEPVFAQVETWDTYDWGSTADGSEQIRKYRDLEFGGSTIYMPTFNKNADSLASDINGTLAGADGDKDTDSDAYEDNYVYSDGESKTEAAYYDMDADTDDEGDASVEGTNHYVVSETHYATPTLDATVISMDTWLLKDASEQIGNFWVYDTDGWAYWAAPLECETATGLLLTGLETVEDPTLDWYYAINVVSQMATKGDWGMTAEDAEDGTATGMYEGGMTANGLNLLNQISGMNTSTDEGDGSTPEDITL